ncbi:MAG: DUF3489 domain-containing protein [Paracoccaceae bacterium]
MTDQSSQTEPEHVAATRQPARTKGPSKKNQLIKLLSRKSGADAASISAKFGWQPHTTRAALSGLRKAGYDITKGNVGSDKQTRYRIEGAPNAVAAAEVIDGK